MLPGVLGGKDDLALGHRMGRSEAVCQNDDFGNVLGEERDRVLKSRLAEHEHAQDGLLPFASAYHRDAALGGEHGFEADGDSLMTGSVVAAAEASLAGSNDRVGIELDDLGFHVLIVLESDALKRIVRGLTERDESLVADACPDGINASDGFDHSVDLVKILNAGPDALAFRNVQLRVYLVVEAVEHSPVGAFIIVAEGIYSGVPVEQIVHVEDGQILEADTLAIDSAYEGGKLIRRTGGEHPTGGLAFGIVLLTSSAIMLPARRMAS